MHEQVSQSTQKPARRYQCRHIFADGRRCGSPGLRNEDFCFYHRTDRPTTHAHTHHDRYCSFDLPRIEDRASILVAIEHVLQRLANDVLDTRRAGLLLYGLQTACQTLPKEDGPKRDAEPVEEIIRHPSLGAVARRAIVVTEGAEGEAQPTLAEQEELAALDNQEDTPEALNPKPTGFAAMTQEEIVQLYEKHTANLSRPAPTGTTPQPSILSTLNAAAFPSTRTQPPTHVISTEAHRAERRDPCISQTAANARVPHPCASRMGGKARTPTSQPPCISIPQRSGGICFSSLLATNAPCDPSKAQTRTHPPFLLS